MSTVAPDPTSWEADVVLRDGSVAQLRPIRPQDKDALQAFHKAQSPESIYLRFFAPLPELSRADLVRYTEVDQRTRVALVATVQGALAGIGRFDEVRPGTAEVAFNVSDSRQGLGLGSVLLEHLAAVGRELGYTTFVAEVLPQNRAMLGVFRDAGYAMRHGFEDGVVAVSLDLTPTSRSEGVRHAREQRAEAVSVRCFLRPTSIVVVGASQVPGDLGGAVLRSILDGGFCENGGVVHVVGTHGERPAATHQPDQPERGSLDAPHVESVRDVEGADLAVVALAAERPSDAEGTDATAGTEAVRALLADCAAAGIRAVLLLGGAGADPGEGAALRDHARSLGLRLLGPGSYGIACAAAHLNATPAPAPAPGGLALFAQSGAVGVAALGSVRRRGIGLSLFVSAGQRVDVSGNDVLQYVLDDPSSRVVGMHLETVGNPRKFARIARQVGRTTPVVVVTAGTVGVGGRPGADAPGDRPGVLSVMLRQAGVVEVASVHALTDVAQLLLTCPLPAGPRVAVVGDSPGLVGLSANAATAQGLDVVRTELLTGRADALADAARGALAEQGCDAVVVCHEPPPAAADPAGQQLPADLATVAHEHAAPVLLTQVDASGVVAGCPVYSMPEDAVRALAAAHAYARWRAAEPAADDAAPEVEADRRRAYDVVAQALATPPDDPEGGAPPQASEPETAARPTSTRLDPGAASALLGAYGIELDAGGTRHDGVDLAVSTHDHPVLGPVVAVSLADPLAVLLGDIAYAVPPLTWRTARELDLRAIPVLDDADPSGAGRDVLAAVITRVAQLADDFPHVDELHLVVRLTDGSADVLGAEIDVAPPGRRSDSDRRALTR